MKTVFDTNVLYASLISREGLCAEVVRTSVLRHTIVISDFILDELRRHLAQTRKLNSLQIDGTIQSIRTEAIVVEPAVVESGICRDANDLPILGTAIAGGADLLVTGDQDLLVLTKLENIEIISPRAFHDRFIATT